jgi:2-keto-4-pentenoate hydratase/2-oxohepta-3-ene-1,7-dioic acid hydratase in catechol pathway
MTGTPGGVGWFKKPQASLKDGDVIEVEITGLGILRNTMQFV